MGDVGNILARHAAVDLQANGVTGGVNQGPGLAQLVEGCGNERLAAKARVHRHQQHHVHLVHDVLERVQANVGIEHQAALAAGLADHLQGAVDVGGGVRVEGNPAGPGLGEVADQAVHRGHHQVHINRSGDPVFAQGLADHGADGEIGDVVVIHDIEVHHVRACGQHPVDFFAEAGEIRRQDGRCDKVVGHGETPAAGKSAILAAMHLGFIPKFRGQNRAKCPAPAAAAVYPHRSRRR